MKEQFKVGIVGLGLIGGIAKALIAYRDALAAEDDKTLLREGRLAKERVDRAGEEDR